MVEAQQWSAPGLEQQAELAMGELPREFQNEEELTPAARRLYASGQLWPTMTAQDATGAARRTTTTEAMHPGVSLNDAINTGMWATPTERDWKDGHADYPVPTASRLGLQAPRTLLDGRASSPPTPGSPPPSGSAPLDEFERVRLSRRRLNPRFVEWLMGLPDGWTDFAPLATASSRLRPPSRSASSGTA
jgi:hypothetical protein